eukprot:7079046-Prymnesium_polylepis.1
MGGHGRQDGTVDEATSTGRARGPRWHRAHHRDVVSTSPTAPRCRSGDQAPASNSPDRQRHARLVRLRPLLDFPVQPHVGPSLLGPHSSE